MKKISSFLVFLFSFFPLSAFANNLSISNVSLESRDSINNTVIVEFDITWDNSWRTVTNYDAVWLVLKVTIGSATPVRGLLDDDGVNPLGTSPGTNQNLEILVPTDNRTSSSQGHVGAFLYRKASGTGTVASKNVRLKLDYGLSGAGDTSNITVKVIGTEMVYIPEAPFFAGDTSSTAAFKKGSSSGHPWYIESENTVRTTTTTSGSFYYTSTGSEGGFASNGVFTLPLQYPKGYGAFYCMKYPVTEGQWVDFINNIDSSSRSSRDITSASGKNSDSVIKRNTSSQTTNASTNRPDRAVSYLAWMDLAAYLDWVALRPMTELEFEKVARGPVAVLGDEYAWGTSNLANPAATIFTSSPEDGNEVFSVGGDPQENVVYNSTTFSNGDDYLGPQHAQGPVRPGIFATSSTDREGAGAGYYGVMDLSGNLVEMVATVGNTTGISYYAVNGDGLLDDSYNPGYAYQLGWVGTSYIGTSGVSDASGTGKRGGSWNQASGALRTSDRSEASTENSSRSNRFGGRGVRSVSPPAMPSCGDLVVDPPEQCDTGGEINEECDGSTCECTGNDICGSGVCDTC